MNSTGLAHPGGRAEEPTEGDEERGGIREQPDGDHPAWSACARVPRSGLVQSAIHLGRNTQQTEGQHIGRRLEERPAGQRLQLLDDRIRQSAGVERRERLAGRQTRGPVAAGQSGAGVAPRLRPRALPAALVARRGGRPASVAAPGPRPPSSGRTASATSSTPCGQWVVGQAFGS